MRTIITRSNFNRLADLTRTYARAGDAVYYADTEREYKIALKALPQIRDTAMSEYAKILDITVDEAFSRHKKYGAATTQDIDFNIV